VWEDHGLVFCQPNGRPVDPRHDHRAWRSLLVGAGVRPVRCTTSATPRQRSCWPSVSPSRVAMQILGHSQISLTLGTYSHVVPRARRGRRGPGRQRAVGPNGHHGGTTDDTGRLLRW